MTTLAGLVPIFLLLGLGVVARRLAILNDAAAMGLNRVVVYFALPALFIAKVGTSPLESALSPRLMVVTVAMVGLATVLALWYARAAALPPPQRGALAQGGLAGAQGHQIGVQLPRPLDVRCRQLVVRGEPDVLR